ncbi:hypothetical protein GCM10008995_01810 [Halobellus salinus]|uniref:ArsR family transcriptional regulator n=1 Tax=Halobellus salinus TaxID=931585 RepID=A0A830ENV9_9EURY|nr:ArsR family transcriptional regulator [Halobellus salinus]GGI95270.1 hypothetical protein GCM10008995_01810 [Halobellus salinus]SMP12112.1 hypothetical protein SAMN06265347_10423 [Halobellus salinus]
MRLRRPTDFLILDVLSDGERNTGANIADLIERDRGYVNTQLPTIEDQGFVKKIGPHQNSGLYQITPLGIAAVQKQSLYSESEDEFETAIRELADQIEITRPSVTIHK